MKFSAILVSVNIAATIPLTVAASAQAAEPAKSDNTSWLKSSLASMDTSVNQKRPAHAGKLSLSQPTPDVNGAVTLHSNGLKMRPFVANRRLPSQRDLDVQLIRQTAKMAANETLKEQIPQYATAPAPLAGNVSEVYATLGDSVAAQQPVASYGNVGYVKQSSSRVAPGQVPAVQGQIRQFKSSKRTRYMAPVREEADGNGTGQPMSPTQMRQTPVQAPIQMPPAPPVAMQQQQYAMQEQYAMQQQQQYTMEPESLQPPVLPPEEQAIIDRMVDASHPHIFDVAPSMEGQQMMSAAGAERSAGPPPFPLNLLPQDSLKQVIGGMRRTRCDAPASYFGSWHNQMSYLPTAGGFARYAPSHTARFTGYHRPAHVYTPAPAHVTGHAPRASEPARPQETTVRSMGQVRRLSPHEAPRVCLTASYAAYPRLSSVGY